MDLLILKNEIQDKALEALTFDKEKIDDSFNVSNSSIYFYNLKFKLILLLNDVEIERTRIKKRVMLECKNDVDFNLSKTAEMNTYIEADDEFCKNTILYNELKSLIKYIEDILEGLKTKHYEMKLWLEYKKFMEGLI